MAVCHNKEGHLNLIVIDEEDLADHLAHGDHPEVIYVDDVVHRGADGSAEAPYNELADAVALAQCLYDVGAPAPILVASGVYEIDETVRIERPIAVTGANDMGRDVEEWPTGELAAGTETRVVGTEALGGDPVIAIGRADGGTIEGVRIQGMTLEAGPGGGDVVDLTRVQDFEVSDNIVTGPAFIGLFTAASSGDIHDNYITGVGCGACIGAGTSENPANIDYFNNRAVYNLFGGLLLNGSSFGIPEHGDQLDVHAYHNDLSYNAAIDGFSFGIRIFTIRRDVGLPGDDQATGNVRAVLEDNRIVGNQFGLSIDAGFPYRQPGGECDNRVYSGTFDLTFHRNEISGNVLTPALISFTRNSAALHPESLGAWQYLHGATFVIVDPDCSLAGPSCDDPMAWIDYPDVDPYLGDCPNDATSELLHDTLVYNGTVADNSRVVETDCSDGVDNDHRGGTDCEDSYCELYPACYQFDPSEDVDLGSAIGSPVWQDSTVGEANDYTLLCGAVKPSQAGDDVLLWTAPEAGTYTFDTIGSALDTVLGVYTPTEILCSEDISGSVWQSSVTGSLQDGDQVTIIVDGFGSDEGPYQLNIERVGP